LPLTSSQSNGLSLFFALFAVLSCVDEKDYNIDSLTVNPSIAIPLTHGDLSVKDLIKNTDSVYVKVYPDDLVYLAYSQTLVTQDIKDLFTIPDKTINQSFVIPAGTIPAHPKDIRSDSLVEVINFNLSPEQLSEVDFKAGTITYSAALLPSSSGLLFEVNLVSSDLISKTTGKGFNVTTSNLGSVALSDYIVKLNNNKFNLKLVLVLKQSATSKVITPNTSVAVNFTMAGMDFNYIKGFFGDQTANPPATSLEIGAFGSSLTKANLSIAQPSVKLIVVNDYGVPLTGTFIKLEARKSGAVLPFQINPPNPVTIASPALLGSSATTNVSVTNAKALLDFGPTEFYYQLSARINQGVTGGNNFLADTSKLRVKLDVEIPLYGHASAIVLTDTIKLNVSDINQSQIDNASLKVNIKNELPLDAKIQFYLTDDKFQIIDSLLATSQTSLVKGSTVTSTGDLQAMGLVEEDVLLDDAKINKLFLAKNIIIKAQMNTSKDAGGQSPDVKFKSAYKMNINLGLKANLKFNVKL
jgi:hypothetical protein